MCGIFGFITDKPSEENAILFRRLCYLSAIRGTDASGFAMFDKQGKMVIEKRPMPASKFIPEVMDKYMPKMASSNLVIGHTRKKTQGDPADNANNHPVFSDKWVMIHNGVCSSMGRLDGYPYLGEVDSEILLSYVEREGLAEGLGNLKGWASVALLNKDEANNIYLWRHNETLYLAYDRESKTIFFASTDDLLSMSLANELEFFTSFQIKKFPEDVIYKVSHSPLSIEKIKEVEVKKAYDYSKWSGTTNFPTAQKSQPTTLQREKVNFIWDKIKGVLFPVGSNGNICVSNKYYFGKQSCDFNKPNWIKAGKAFFSIDRKFVKIWDKNKRCHFLMLSIDAYSEGLLDSGDEEKGD